MYDLIVRGGTLVTPRGPVHADMAVADGRIVALEADLAGTAHETIDAHGLHVLPGLIDAHVHFNDPGRAHWEGWASGTQALAVGGGTLAIDMPLNANPPTISAAAFHAKCAAATGNALTDFALWGGIVPGNHAELAALAALGVVGFKAFLSNSGIADFPAADDLTLYAGMQAAAELGRVVAVHAENDAMTTGLAAQAVAAGRTGMADYLASRPVMAECEAIQRALLLAAEVGCALHIVHVSSGRGVTLVAEARARGQDVSCETCPHYLVLTAEDAERLGALAKCAPPLRSRTEQATLWAELFAGNVPIIASDHSPAPPSDKGVNVDGAPLDPNASIFALWGGIAGVQTTLPLLLDAGVHQRGLPLETLAALTARNPAARFGLDGRKGAIMIGRDADLAFIALDARYTLHRDDLHDRHRLNPYVGRSLRGRVVRTVRRGETIALHGRPVGRGGGRFMKAGER
jgi:allantoinase